MSLKAFILGLCCATVGAAPANDHFQNATVLSGTEAVFVLDTYAATIEASEPEHPPAILGSGPVNESVWYRWTAPASGMLNLAVAANPQQATYYASGLYRGNSLATLEALPRSEGAGTASYLWPVLAGETYSLAIGVQASVPDYLLTTNRLTFMPPATHFDFGTRPVLATNKSSSAFAFTRAGSTNPLEGQLLWWRLPERSESGTERLILYNSSPAEWFVYEGDATNSLRLVETAKAENAPNSPELYFIREPGRIYSLAFRPASSSRTGVFTIYDLFTTLRLKAESEPVRSGTNVTLRFEGIPEIGHSNAVLILSAGQPWSIAAWQRPFPSSYVVENIEAGTHEFYLRWQDNLAQRADWARLRLEVEHANDDFAQAQILEGSTPLLKVDLRGASVEPGEPWLPSQSVWFSWIAPETGRLVVEDWRIELYQGSSLATLERAPLAAGFTDWSPVYSVVAGEKYYLRARDGNFQMEYQKQIWLIPDSARPGNDNFSAAELLTGTNITRQISALGSTIENDEPINPATGTIWYRWTSPSTGRAYIRGDGTGALTVYTGNQLGALQPWNEFERLEAGRTLYIRYAGSSTRTNDFVLHLNLVSSPVNDDFAAATLLPGVSGAVQADFIGASNEPNEPAESQFVPIPAVWYQWRAPATGHLFLQRLQVGLHSQVRLFRGSSSIEPINSSATIFPVTGGLTYHIRFATGAATTLRYEFLGDEVQNDLVSNATRVDGADVDITARTFLATRSDDDPTNVLRTVWFRWQAPTNGLAQISAPPVYQSHFAHRVVVFREDQTQEIAAGLVPGTLSFPVQGGSDYLFMVGVYTNSSVVPAWAVGELLGSVVDISLLFTTYHLTSPVDDAVFTTNDVVTARISEPVAGIDLPIVKVKYFLPPPGSGPDLMVESTNTFLTLTNRLGNQRVGATIEFANGRKVDLARVQYRVIDPSVSHDEFAGRELLVGRHVRRELTRQELAAATWEPGETQTNGMAPSLWFKWVAPADGMVSMAPISVTQPWPVVFRSWQGSQWAAASSSSTIYDPVIFLPPLVPELVAPIVDVFEGTNLTSLNLVAILPQNIFLAKKGVEYSMRLFGVNSPALFEFHLTTISAISPAPDAILPSGVPLAIELETTEATEDILSLDVIIGAQKVASFSTPPFRTTINNLAPGEHLLRSVLSLRSGEILTNVHSLFYVLPANASAAAAMLVKTNFAFDVRGFTDQGEGRGRITGPPLFYEVRPTENLAVYTREAALRVFNGGLHGTELNPYTFVPGPNTNSTWQDRPVFELAAGGVYLLEVSQLFQESGSVKFVPRPINDAIENAIVLPSPGTNIAVNIKLLRHEENEPGSIASAWYRWQSPGDGYIRLTKYAYVYGENDLTNSIGFIQEALPAMVYPVTAGTKYFIGFAEQYPDEPSETVEFNFLADPDHDRIAFAKELRSMDLTLSFNFFAVETEPKEVSLGSTNAIGPLWWKWRSPANGALVLTVDAEPPPRRGRAQLCVLQGTNIVRVAAQRSRYAEWYEVQAGKEYFIAVERVADFPWSWEPSPWEFVPMTLHLRLLSPPGNDHFAAAERVTENVLVHGRTHFATAEPTEPWHNGFPAAQSVWYKWTAPLDATAYVKYSSAKPADYALRSFAVYRGSDYGNLSLVRRTPALQIPWLGLRFDAEAGAEYFIVVDGRAGTEDFTLAIETEALPFEILGSQAVNGAIVFQLPSILNTPITIERSSDLKWWMNYQTYPPNYPGPFSVPIDESEGQVFYRIAAGFGYLSDVGQP